MKKIVSFILFVMMVACMGTSANAATIVPISKIGTTFKMPKVVSCDIPKAVQEKVTTTIPANLIDKIAKQYPAW